MDQNRAKNVIIITLIIINAVLGVFLATQKNFGYRVSNKRQATIKSFLEKNNIEFNGELIKDYSPKKKILANKIAFEEKYLTDIFFTEPAQRSSEAPNVVFQNGEGTLYIHEDGAKFSFISRKSGGEGGKEIVKERAVALCENIIKKLGAQFKNYRQDRIFEADSGRYAIIYYRDNFKGFKINSSYLRFAINENGVVEAACEAYEAAGFSDEPKRNIAGADDALLTLVRDRLASENFTSFSIESIELTYSLEDANYDSDAIYLAPFYAVYVSESPEDPRLIDAYYLTLP
jgi:hypothetical protein